MSKNKPYNPLTVEDRGMTMAELDRVLENLEKHGFIGCLDGRYFATELGCEAMKSGLVEAHETG